MRPVAVVISLAMSAYVVVGATPRVLTPGSSDVTTDHLRESTTSYRYLSRPATGDTAERETATGRVEQHLMNYKRKPAVLLVSIFNRPDRTFVDSALVMRAGLVPVWETSRFGGGVTRYEYNGRRVSLEVTSPDSGTRKRDHTYDVPVFHFSELDVLLRSLPLREGFEAILPLYSEGSDQLEMDTVRVMSRGSDGAWSVRFADPAIVSTYGIDGTTREVLRQDVISRQSGAHSRKVPIQ